MGKVVKVATFVRNATRFSSAYVERECESITIKIWTGKYELATINYYNQCNKLGVVILNIVMGKCRGK